MENFSIVTYDGNNKNTFLVDIRWDDDILIHNQYFLTKGIEGCLFYLQKKN